MLQATAATPIHARDTERSDLLRKVHRKLHRRARRDEHREPEQREQRGDASDRRDRDAISTGCPRNTPMMMPMAGHPTTIEMNRPQRPCEDVDDETGQVVIDARRLTGGQAPSARCGKVALRRSWRGSEVPVGINRNQDALYRVVGKGGVVLIAEGSRTGQPGGFWALRGAQGQAGAPQRRDRAPVNVGPRRRRAAAQALEGTQQTAEEAEPQRDRRGLQPPGFVAGVTRWHPEGDGSEQGFARTAALTSTACRILLRCSDSGCFSSPSKWPGDRTGLPRSRPRSVAAPGPPCHRLLIRLGPSAAISRVLLTWRPLPRALEHPSGSRHANHLHPTIAASIGSRASRPSRRVDQRRLDWPVAPRCAHGAAPARDSDPRLGLSQRGFHDKIAGPVLIRGYSSP
ncbi:hypothetical protein FQA39_LY18698 [Lamprigera yunnana]|nr:hypothetical protein FQA39_LY18698 [Lamprigera yunnana]